MKRLLSALVILGLAFPAASAPLVLRGGGLKLLHGNRVVLEFDADGLMTTGSASAGSLTADSVDGTQLADIIALDTTTIGLKNSSTGSVILNFHDYADSADDDQAHAAITVNCTDATTGAEDCDLSIGVAEAGAAAEARFSIDADGGVTIGSANNNSFTVTTDSTGTGEVVLPTDAISSGEITDVTRSIAIPLGSIVPCAGTVPGVWDASGADAEPDLVALNTALAIVYDDTGGSEDTDEVCTSFTVPADYVSGGTFVFRVIADAATGANVESIEARISVDGAAIGAADEDNLASSAAVQSITSAPTGTWAAGASIGLAFKQGLATPDDTVNVLSVEARYTATQ